MLCIKATTLVFTSECLSNICITALIDAFWKAPPVLHLTTLLCFRSLQLEQSYLCFLGKPFSHQTMNDDEGVRKVPTQGREKIEDLSLTLCFGEC